jgi:hypothetical protein
MEAAEFWLCWKLVHVYPNKLTGVCTSDRIYVITKEAQSGDYSMIILASIEVSVVICC